MNLQSYVAFLLPTWTMSFIIHTLRNCFSFSAMRCFNHHEFSKNFQLNGLKMLWKCFAHQFQLRSAWQKLHITLKYSHVCVLTATDSYCQFFNQNHLQHSQLFFSPQTFASEIPTWNEQYRHYDTMHVVHLRESLLWFAAKSCRQLILLGVLCVRISAMVNGLI